VTGSLSDKCSLVLMTEVVSTSLIDPLVGLHYSVCQGVGFATLHNSVLVFNMVLFDMSTLFRDSTGEESSG
jgi:hypothetical protein